MGEASWRGSAPRLICIAGGSCSGKTTLATALAEALGPQRTSHIALDRYYRDLSDISAAARAQVNFDAPDALDGERIAGDVGDLMASMAISAPVYDFRSHTRTDETTTIAPSDFVIVEGLYALYWEELRAYAHARVFVHAPHEICLARRVVRDVESRGRTRVSVESQYEATVRPMYEHYVRPTREFAEIWVDGTERFDDVVTAITEKL